MTIETTRELGKQVRLTRKALGLKQSDLALTAGTGLRFIIDLEKGKATCQVGKVLDVISTLGLTMTVEPRSGN